MHIRIPIASEIEITTDWQKWDLDLPPCPKNRFQEISLELVNCKQYDKSGELVFGDGTSVRPRTDIEVEVENVEGKTYLLESGSYSVNNYDVETETWDVHSAGFKLLESTGRWARLRIRSEQSFHCENINWHNYNLK